MPNHEHLGLSRARPEAARAPETGRRGPHLLLARPGARIAAVCLAVPFALALAAGHPDDRDGGPRMAARAAKHGARARAEDPVRGGPFAPSPGSPVPSAPPCSIPEVQWERLAREPQTRIVALDEKRVADLCESFARANVRAIARIDSLYRAGLFGGPGSREAAHGARLAFALLSQSAFDYVADLGTRRQSIATANTAALRRPFGEMYLHCGAYPFQSLRQALAGNGRFRMEYDLVEDVREQVEFAIGRPVEVRDETVEADGRETHVLRMPYPTSEHGEIELLFASPYHGCISRFSVVDRGDTLDVILLAGIKGGYVRKHGIHRLAGIAAWKSRFDERNWDPHRARVGAAAYLPGIHVELPWLLPDMGVEDVREFRVPQPILSREFVRSRRGVPPWLDLTPSGMIAGWEPEGPRPKLIDVYFPDR